MEGDGRHPNLPKSSSAGLLTFAGAPSKLPVRRLAPRGSVPPPSPAAADRSGASSSRGHNKGKTVDNSGAHNDITTTKTPPTTTRNNNRKGRSGGTSGGRARGRDSGRDQDMHMPIANVIRIMRQVLPLHAKITDDAKETIQECVSEYISFVTAEANERCRQEQRKTITAEDLLYAMCKLGFDDYIGPMTAYLQRYREAEGSDARGSLRGTVRSELPPLKRNASDAGLYMQQYQMPQYPLAAFQSFFPNPASPNIPQHAYVQQQPAFFPGADGSSSGGQGLLPPLAPLPLSTPAALPLPLPLPLPLNYYRPEAPAYREEPAPVPVSPPAPAYRDMPIYSDLGGHNDMAGSSSSTDAAGPSHQASFSDFGPFVLYK